MNIFIEEHQKVISLLLKNKVDFIIVGGYAVIYHGYGRTTGDMDVWIKPDDTNKEKLVSALRAFGIVEDDLIEISRIDFTGIVMFYFGNPPERIDFATRVAGLNYDEADKKKVLFSIEGYEVPILNFDHLIINKLLSDRPKDKADVDELQKIMRLKKK